LVSKLRAQRIGDRIREELSELLVYDISDPRLKGVSITDVRVDREVAYADVFVSALEGQQRSAEILEGFEHAIGFIRYELSHRIDLRTFPRLRFRWDPTYERADKIDKLIASLSSETSMNGLDSDLDLINPLGEENLADV